jgi:hypothetical protein
MAARSGPSDVFKPKHDNGKYIYMFSPNTLIVCGQWLLEIAL